MAPILIDTSAIYALLDRSDGNHTPAVETLQQVSARRADILVTNFVVAESHALIVARLGHGLACRWLNSLVWPVERAGAGDEARARDIIRDFADKDFSLTDAISFAVMERLQLTRAFAFDRHFTQFGFESVGSL